MSLLDSQNKISKQASQMLKFVKGSERSNILVKKVDPSHATFRTYSGGLGPAPRKVMLPSGMRGWRAAT